MYSGAGKPRQTRLQMEADPRVLEECGRRNFQSLALCQSPCLSVCLSVSGPTRSGTSATLCATRRTTSGPRTKAHQQHSANPRTLRKSELCFTQSISPFSTNTQHTHHTHTSSPIIYPWTRRTSPHDKQITYVILTR